MPSRLLTWGTLCLALFLAGLTAPSYAGAGDEGLPLPKPLGGQAALHALGDDVGIAARLNRMSPEALTHVLATDPTARLDRSGRMFYADTMAVQPAEAAAAAPYPYDQTFELHSLPGANRVIFLDFDGATVSGTVWNEEDGLPAGFFGGLNEDGAAGFSNAEKDIVQAVWQRVAEDYAPFAVDVTTQDPGAAALQRISDADQTYGMRVLVTEDADAPSILCGGCQGIAYVGVFNAWWSDPGWLQPAFAFTDTFDNNPSMLADIITHEVGHTLALSHDGVLSGAEYYSGQGVWHPIMGAGVRRLSQFSNGEYGGANNTQDDLAIIQQFGAPLRGDDHGSTAATATPVTSSAAGVVTTREDVDWFSVEQGCTGPFSVQVSPAPTGPNLDIQLTVQTADGTTVATDDPDVGVDPGTNGLVGLGASYTNASLPDGTYKIGVEGVGHGNTNVDGYSDYGSLGAYTLDVDTSCTAPTAPGSPQSLALVDATRSSLAVSWLPPSDLGGQPVERYEVRRGTGSWVQLATSAPLEWTFTGLAANTTYSVSVRAVNSVGAGDPASIQAKTDPPAKPSAPRIGTAVSGVSGGSITAKAAWSAPLSNGGATITAYKVIALRMSSSGTVLSRTTKTVGPTVRRTAVLLRSGRYRFQVVAINAVGASPLSARSNRVTAR
jgi:hypothetical protein